MERQYISVSEAAEMSGFAAYTIREWLKSGRIDGAKKIGKLWRIPISWMEKGVKHADIQKS